MLGIHVRKENKSLHDSIIAADFEAVQVFLLNPFSGAETTDADDIRKMKLLKKRIIVHGCYVNNPWNSGSVGLIKREMTLCYEAGCEGLIVHLGKNTLRTLDRVLRGIGELRDEILESVTLWFEINSIRPEFAFDTPQKINALFRSANKIVGSGALHIGLCIDTAHLWSCGVSWSTYEAAEIWLSKLDKNIAIMFHLNDSSENLGGGKDVHAALCDGNIWKKYKGNNLSESGIAAVVNYAEKHNSIVILERDSENVARDLAVLGRLGFSAR